MNKENSKRKEELIKIFDNIDKDKKFLVMQLIDEVVFLEEQINEIKKYPLFRKSQDTKKIYMLENLRVYKEFLTQYNITIKNLSSFLKRNETEEMSPLEEWIKNNGKDE